MKGRIYHIGRSNNSNEIFIFDESVSTIHAQILIDENDDLIIIDLASKNGVFVNGDRIVSPIKLITGDTITLGGFKCTQNDLSHAIKVFDYKNNESNLQSVVLKSSILNPQKNKKIKKININFNNSNLWIWIILIIITLLISFGLYSMYNQNELQDKYNKRDKKSDTEINNTNKEEGKDEKNPSIKNKKSKRNSKQRTDVTYDFSCMSTENDGGSNESLIVIGTLTRDVQNSMLNDIKITIKEEEEYGDDFINEMEKTHRFINSGSDLTEIKTIMNNLINRLAEPKGFNYKIYLVEDTIINAFTLGGRIVITTDMYNFCKNDSELASVISHEIAHNELGHITLNMKKQKAAQDFGVFGEIALGLESVITSSFNQKQEAEADLFGIDIMYPTAYKSCSSITLWKRMANKESDFNVVDNFMRSHPYSKNRANCIDHHLQSNYNKNCD